MTVRRVPIAELLQDPDNARRRSKTAKAKLETSLRTFGAARSLVADGNGVIRAGNGTLEAAAAAGVKDALIVEADGTELIVVQRADWSADEARAYALADNQIGTLATWDDDTLNAHLAELNRSNDDLLAACGFDPGELLKRIGEPDTSADPGALEPPANPVTKPGELWLLGKHRLVCGDSTDEANAKLAQGDLEPFIMVTDPPYGVEYDPKWRDEALGDADRATGLVKNDDRADWGEAWSHFPGPVAYVWHGNKTSDVVYDTLRLVGFRVRCCLVWVKPHFAIGQRVLYHQQHEPCVVAQRGDVRWSGGRKQTTVWEITSIHLSGETRYGKHSTQKPVECMARPLRNHGSKGDVVYDPFLGSGTTLIAADMEERICCGLELDPGYCDAIIQRWEEATGGKAVRG